jgi:cell division protein FtsB
LIFINAHIDISSYRLGYRIAQFHQQSQEMNNALSKHLETIERLTGENQRLHEENERLRQSG